MIIVIDKDIPFAESMFAGRADVVALPGEKITPGMVHTADAVIVRSVTRIDEGLLAGSSVGFVGTATSGVDHVDRSYLSRRGIEFAHAPGCNAESVAEYVAAALLELGGKFDLRLEGMTMGIVGVGNVGRKVAQKAGALGLKILLNDPPLARKSGDPNFVNLDDLNDADIVSLHVPLNRTGPDATYHLFDRARLGTLKPGAMLINTARGGVVETAALSEALISGRIRGAVIDVWEGEPAIDPGAVGMASIATAHIAGYSADGKVRGAAMMYDAICDWKGWKKSWVVPADACPPPGRPECIVGADSEVEDQEVLRNLVATCCPLMRDDTDLRRISLLSEEERSGYFIGLRNQYPPRREFGATTVSVIGARSTLSRTIGALGFSLRQQHTPRASGAQTD